MFYIFSGPDDYSIARSIDEIKKDIDDQAMFPMATTKLDGQQLTPEQLQIACSGATLLNEKQLVVIQGLLTRFQSAGGGQQRQRKGARNTGPQDDHQSFSSIINQISEGTVLVLVEEGIENDNPLFKALAGRAVVRSFPMLRDSRLRHWIDEQVSNDGGSISQRAIELLVRLVGNNLWIMSGEISKLILYTGGRRIEEVDVRSVVGYVQQANVFTMIDAIIEYNGRKAMQSLSELVQTGATSSYLLAMLSRQVRLIIRARELTRQKKTRAEIQRALGLVSEYALRIALEQARKYTLKRLKHIHQKLLEADLAIKTGKYSEELALNILVAELSQREPVASSASRD